MGLLVLGCGSSSGSEDGDEGVLRFTIVGEADEPLADAIVVVDATGGSRFEATTDADGVAAFPSVDSKAGPVDVTAFSPGRVLVTVFGVDSKSSKLLHMEWEWEARPRRPITVSIENKLAADDCVYLQATPTSRQSSDPCVDSGEVEVPVDATGKVWALESKPGDHGPKRPLVAAVGVDFSAATDSVTVDLSKSAPIEQASGEVPLPDQDNVWSPMGPWAGEVSVGSAAAVGGYLKWDLDFVRLTADADAYTGLQVVAQVNDTQAALLAVQADGYPGPTASGFPEFASWVSPTASPTLFGPISWTASADRPDRLGLAVDTTSGGVGSWFVWFPSTWDSVSLKKPPDSIWNQLGWKDDDFTVSVMYCDPVPGECAGDVCDPTETPACRRFANSLDLSHAKQ